MVAKLFSVTENLRPFAAAKGRRWMCPREQVDMAGRFMEALLQSDYRDVLAIETGVAPLVTVMQLLDVRQELRFHFANPDALEAGLRRARREPWVFSCRIDANRQELVVRPGGDRDRRPQLRLLRGGLA